MRSGAGMDRKVWTSEKVLDWVGHANISTTRMYDRRRSRAEDSPTFKVADELIGLLGLPARMQA